MWCVKSKAPGRPPSPAFLIPKPFSGLGIFCVADKTDLFFRLMKHRPPKIKQHQQRPGGTGRKAPAATFNGADKGMANGLFALEPAEYAPLPIPDSEKIAYYSILRISCTRSAITMGLDKKPFIPLSRALRRSSSKAFAVMARMGIPAKAGFSNSRMRWVAV